MQSLISFIPAVQKIEDIKSFVRNELKTLSEDRKNLEIHICASETILETNNGCNERFQFEHAIVRNEADPSQIIDFLESLISRQQDIWQILHLACLWSLCYNGIPSKQFQRFQALFLHAYGYEHIVSLYNLKLLGLFTEQNAPVLNSPPSPLPNQPSKRKTCVSNFSQVKKTLNLCPKPNESPSSSGYVFSDAYTPIACRLLELLVSDGWQPNLIQKAFGADVPHFCTNSDISKPDKRLRKAILVCFLGGITYAEIASIRRFAQDNNFRIIILTTHIIQREAFMKSLTELI